MSRFRIVPQIFMYDTFGEFADDENIGEKDLLVTNEYIYEPFIKKYGLKCGLCFQEKYGNGEPTDVMMENIVSDIQLDNYERIVAIGGGTIIDISKILALKSFSDVDELYARKELVKDKTLLVIPTTCGTGSEVTSVSVLNRTRLGTKAGLVGDSLFADKAVLIPEFLTSLPYKVFATSSIDALVHAVESYLNPLNNNLIEMYALKAMELIIVSYLDIVNNGKDCIERHNKDLILASCMAGVAFGNNGCGAVHALSYALGGRYHVPHGESNYQFFMEVLSVYEKKDKGGKIQLLKEKLAHLLNCEIDGSLHELEKLLSGILENKFMADYGAVEADVADFTASTIKTQQRLLKGSYITLEPDDIEAIYRNRLKK